MRWARRGAVGLAVVLVVSLLGLTAAAGAPGDLDSTFDGDGVVRTQAAHPAAPIQFSGAEAVAVQRDGRIVVAGSARDADNTRAFGVARYLSDGTLDASFGGDGVVHSQPADPAAVVKLSAALAVAVQDDGKIVTAGFTRDGNNNQLFAAVRYNPDGTLDAGFGSGGIVRTQVADPSAATQWSTASAVAVQGDGRIVVGGFTRDGNNNHTLAVVRYDVDGSLDAGFGAGGIVRTQAADPSASAQASFASAVAVQGDGRILTVGQTLDADSNVVFAVVRYDVDGSLDAGFGGGGIVRTQAADPTIGSQVSRATAVAVQGDGKIVAAGAARVANTRDGFAVVRYLPDGGLDAGFGGGGIVRTDAADPTATQVSEAFAVAVQTDGKIVAAGRAPAANDDLAFAAVRYDPDGSLDAGFGVVRVQASDPGATFPSSGAFAVAVQGDGKIVAAGRARDANDDDVFALVRHEGGVPVAVGERIAGADRHATAAAVAERLGGCAVVVANGQDFPDGLAGAVLGLPVLLTRTDTLPAPTVAHLAALRRSCRGGVESIVVVGGTAAVSAEVFDQLGGYGAEVDRVAGANRYDTAIAIAELVGVGDTVILATGDDFPDALAGGVLAADRGMPIVLHRGETLRPDVAAFFAANPQITKAFVLGGTAALPAGVTDELGSRFGIAVERLAGADRHATAAAVAGEVFGGPGCVLLVNGAAFPDALAAGPHGADRGCPIALVNRTSIPAATRRWITANTSTLDAVVAVGGTAVISNQVLTTAAGLA